MMKKTTFDIVLIGGGITGLWALNRLTQLGLNCALFESNTLGGGQTLHSQGIIHGGIKYALTGFLTNSATEIANMPNRWKQCLAYKDENKSHDIEIDLSSVNILSHDQLLWSTGQLTSDLTTFFASFALQSRIKSLKQPQYPVVLQNPAFKGRVYRLEEIVLDVPSLIECLVRPVQDKIFKIDNEEGCKIQYSDTEQTNKIQSLIFKNNNDRLEVTAKHYVFTSGEGNEKLLHTLTKAPEMQRRPLHMVMVRMPKAFPFYAHCLDNGVNPRITITSHTTSDGKCIWYLGGQIAEDGVKRTQAEQIAFTQQELKKLFPYLDLTKAEYASFFINRAEMKGKDGKRPDSFCLETKENISVAWPTKLALTPLLVDALIASLEKNAILSPSPLRSTSDASTQQNENIEALTNWEKPKIGQPPWEKMEFSCKNED